MLKPLAVLTLCLALLTSGVNHGVITFSQTSATEATLRISDAAFVLELDTLDELWELAKSGLGVWSDALPKCVSDATVVCTEKVKTWVASRISAEYSPSCALT